MFLLVVGVAACVPIEVLSPVITRPSGLIMMPEHHECVMSSAMSIMGQFGVDAVHIAPLLIFILKAASHTS